MVFFFLFPFLRRCKQWRYIYMGRLIMILLADIFRCGLADGTALPGFLMTCLTDVTCLLLAALLQPHAMMIKDFDGK